MKKLLIIPMLLCLLILASCDSSPKKTIPTSNTYYENIIGTPKQIENLEVAQHDFPNKMNWYNAKAECAKLGKGWRLPTKDELDVMYKNKDRVGGFDRVDGFAYNVYWSSTEYDNISAWLQNFNAGFQTYGFKNYAYSVRAVRAF